MRRSVVVALVVSLALFPGAASAKLLAFGFEVTPLHPDAGDPITVTMTCYFDRSQRRPMSSCFGDEGVMAWVHPIDNEGDLDRDDRLAVYGHPTPAGASQGKIVLDEPGTYDVMPLWRRWRDPSIDGLPGVLRIEVAGMNLLASSLVRPSAWSSCLSVQRSEADGMSANVGSRSV